MMDADLIHAPQIVVQYVQVDAAKIVVHHAAMDAAPDVQIIAPVTVVITALAHAIIHVFLAVVVDVNRLAVEAVEAVDVQVDVILVARAVVVPIVLQVAVVHHVKLVDHHVQAYHMVTLDPCVKDALELVEKHAHLVLVVQDAPVNVKTIALELVKTYAREVAGKIVQLDAQQLVLDVHVNAMAVLVVIAAPENVLLHV